MPMVVQQQTLATAEGCWAGFWNWQTQPAGPRTAAQPAAESATPADISTREMFAAVPAKRRKTARKTVMSARSQTAATETDIGKRLAANINWISAADFAAQRTPFYTETPPGLRDPREQKKKQLTITEKHADALTTSIAHTSGDLINAVDAVFVQGDIPVENLSKLSGKTAPKRLTVTGMPIENIIAALPEWASSVEDVGFDHRSAPDRSPLELLPSLNRIRFSQENGRRADVPEWLAETAGEDQITHLAYDNPDLTTTWAAAFLAKADRKRSSRLRHVQLSSLLHKSSKPLDLNKFWDKADMFYAHVPNINKLILPTGKNIATQRAATVCGLFAEPGSFTNWATETNGLGESLASALARSSSSVTICTYNYTDGRTIDDARRSFLRPWGCYLGGYHTPKSFAKMRR